MAQQHAAKTEVVSWEAGEYGVIGNIKHGWHGYAVVSRDDAYAKLERIEKLGSAKRRAEHSDDER